MSSHVANKLFMKLCTVKVVLQFVDACPGDAVQISEGKEVVFGNNIQWASMHYIIADQFQ